MDELRLPNPIRPAFTSVGHEDHVIVSIGPSHPATHGTIQIIAELDGEKVVRQERMLQSLGRRIRDVRVGPDGLVYLLTDSPEGAILRLSPR